MEEPMMSRMLSVLALSFAVLASGACADKYLNEASSTQPRGTAFDNALSRDYLAMAKSENVQSDYKDTETFARRSQAAAQGKPTLPDEPGLRKTWLGSGEAGELSQARQRLVTQLDRNNRTTRPEIAARAQVMYDCWLEQEAEGFQYDHIAACRDQFMAALAELEKPFPVAPVPKAAAPEKFLVFFDWDKYVVTPEGRRVVASAAEAFKTSGRATIVATGYTDLSGPPAYNYKLSERRAAAVKAELVRLGVPATSIRTIGRGENDPLVPTADGVREPQNRRVEIQFQGPGS
jgi:OOP family OmpA-OmpF porin